MTFHIPTDPFRTDAEGASRFCRDLLTRLKWGSDDFLPAVYWERQMCGAVGATFSRMARIDGRFSR